MVLRKTAGLLGSAVFSCGLFFKKKSPAKEIYVYFETEVNSVSNESSYAIMGVYGFITG